MATEQPLIVIAGPTASGKTALGIDIARHFGGEIVCADSRTVYKGMDIGTAKPTSEEQAAIPHWGIDLVEPNERFTAADFKKYAVDKIAEIRARDKLPIIVGGTGLYVDAVLFDYNFGQDADDEYRRDLSSKNLDQLIEYCHENNIELPKNHKNKRYVIRAIEQTGVNNSSLSRPIDNAIVVGIATSSNVLRRRIELRSEQIFSHGVVDEAKMLGEMYGWDSEAMTGNIYPLIKEYLAGNMQMVNVVDKFVTLDWQLAKRQMTWFRRDPYIAWGSANDIKARIHQLFTGE